MSYNNLIQDTSKEERQNLVENALAISLLDADYPSTETINLANQYIAGEIEQEDIKKEIIKKYMLNN